VKSDGECGGYAVLIGASRHPEGLAFLREVLDGKHGGGGGAQGLAARGLAATGDPAALADLAERNRIQRDTVDVFVRGAGGGGWEALERLATAPGASPALAEQVAEQSARATRPETAALIERLWNGGARRAALKGCMALRPGIVDDAALQRLRDIVYGVIRDPAATSIRRTAFYVIEYSAPFQTERARSILQDVVANEADRGALAAARTTLRQVEKALRRGAEDR
jgi:hypothetical protein